MGSLQQRVADLATIKGSYGGFVSREGSCLASGLPAAFDAPRLDRLALAVHRLGLLAEKGGYPRSELILRFKRATLLSLPLDGGAYLSLACRPDANFASVQIFASVAADEIAHELLEKSAPPAPVPAAPIGPDPAEQAAALAKLAPKLAQVKSLFIAEVGPIGQLLFDEAVERWASAAVPAWTQVAPLRKALADEIDNLPRRNAFLNAPVWK